MGYAPLSDGFHSHPKVLALGRDQAAVTLWTLALSYVTQHLTDGFVSFAVARRLCQRNSAVWSRSLVRVGLWQRVKGGYRFHDYLEWQRSRQEIEDLRNKRRIAGSLGGRSKALANAKHDAKQVLGDRSTHVSSRLDTSQSRLVTVTQPVDNSAVGSQSNPDEVAHATGSDSDTAGDNGHHASGRYDAILAKIRVESPELSETEAGIRAVKQLSAEVAKARAP